MSEMVRFINTHPSDIVFLASVLRRSKWLIGYDQMIKQGDEEVKTTNADKKVPTEAGIIQRRKPGFEP